MENLCIQPIDSSELSWNGLPLTYDTILYNLAFLNSLPTGEAPNSPSRSLKKSGQIHSKKACFAYSTLILISLILILCLIIFQDISRQQNIEYKDCKRQYDENHCDYRVPITSNQCMLWEKCMEKYWSSAVSILIKVVTGWISTFIGGLSNASLLIIFGIPLVVLLALVKETPKYIVNRQ